MTRPADLTAAQVRATLAIRQAPPSPRPLHQLHAAAVARVVALPRVDGYFAQLVRGAAVAPIDRVPRTARAWAARELEGSQTFTSRFARAGLPNAGDLLDAVWRWRLAPLLWMPRHVASVRLIADAIGWSSVQALSRWSVRVVGCTPDQWRPSPATRDAWLADEDARFLALLARCDAAPVPDRLRWLTVDEDAPPPPPAWQVAA